MALIHDVISIWNSSYELLLLLLLYTCGAMNVTDQPLCWDHESDVTTDIRHSLPLSRNTTLVH